MAYIKIFPIKVTDKKAIAYITNPDKTEEKLLVSSFGCSPETADLEFTFTREAGKNNVMEKGNNLAFHLIQSFKPGEIDAEKAHELGKQFADYVLKGKYEYVISTHVDKGHIHNHIIFNATNFQDYHKYVSNKRNYHKICRISNRICKENGLSESMPTGEKAKSYKENMEYHRGTSWKAKLKAAVDKAIWSSISFEEFLQKMQLSGYEIRQGKNLSFRAPDQKNFTYMKSLGSYYSDEKVFKRLEKNRHKTKSPQGYSREIHIFIDISTYITTRNQAGFEKWAKLNNLKEAAKTFNYLSEHDLLNYDKFQQHAEDLTGSASAVKQKIESLELKEMELVELKKKCRTYRACRAIVQAESSASDPVRYHAQHQTEYQLHQALRQELLEMGYSKIPGEQKISRMIEQLQSEKQTALQEQWDLQKQGQAFSVVKQNFDHLLLDTTQVQNKLPEVENTKDPYL